MILYIILFMIIRSAICKQISHKSLQCYHCGSETDTGLDFPCEEFTPGFLFEGSCFKDSYCVKTITRNGHTVRGCALRRTAYNYYVHRPGCYYSTNRKFTDIEITCFCDTHLCNQASALISHKILLFTYILFFIINYYLHYYN